MPPAGDARKKRKNSMGREIRRVPANWQHPKYSEETAHNPRLIGEYIPLREGYEAALADFKKSIETLGLGPAIDEWGGGPQSDDYVQYGGAPCDWFQVYETVSEGTPVSPPFATPEELVEYLVQKGDFWSQKRGEPGYSRKAAEAFVGSGWAPSTVIKNGKAMNGIEGAV